MWKATICRQFPDGKPWVFHIYASLTKGILWLFEIAMENHRSFPFRKGFRIQVQYLFLSVWTLIWHVHQSNYSEAFVAQREGCDSSRAKKMLPGRGVQARLAELAREPCMQSLLLHGRTEGSTAGQSPSHKLWKGQGPAGSPSMARAGYASTPNQQHPPSNGKWSQLSWGLTVNRWHRQTLGATEGMVCVEPRYLPGCLSTGIGLKCSSEGVTCHA